MDFELNQKSCPPDCSTNGVTPLRTVHDKLITYDLASGGTHPIISIREWNGTSWSDPDILTGDSLGSINSTAILAAASGGPTPTGLGSLDPFTFGEALISFDAIFPTPDVCGAVGSVYMKSRSSTAFNSEIKDFIAPLGVSLTNCTSLTTTAQTPVTLGQSISDVAHLTGSTLGAGGTITFKALGPNDAGCAGPPVFTSGAIPVNGDGDYNSGPFTPTVTGTYLWTAAYTGDQNNKGATTACGDANETSVVNPAPSTTATELHNNADRR